MCIIFPFLDSNTDRTHVVSNTTAYYYSGVRDDQNVETSIIKANNCEVEIEQVDGAIISLNTFSDQSFSWQAIKTEQGFII